MRILRRNVKNDKIVCVRKIDMLRCNSKDDRSKIGLGEFLCGEMFSFVVFKISDCLVREGVISYGTVLNKFGGIRLFKSVKNKWCENELLIRRMKIPIFNIKNEYVNPIICKIKINTKGTVKIPKSIRKKESNIQVIHKLKSNICFNETSDKINEAKSVSERKRSGFELKENKNLANYKDDRREENITK